MGQDEDMKRMSDLAGQMAQAAAKGSTAGLSLLLAEMNALSAMMPGVFGMPQPALSAKEQEERRRQQEAEVEDSFDNMPV
ncbi:hypothetical protein [Pseudotabrizicola sp. L79]|uniref:hypothetical protein n=1 Tax=Pseudotabrizicola sp. L79 TaxID=3118402 RepID=UPI002F923E44